jgi:hypothetical protein
MELDEIYRDLRSILDRIETVAVADADDGFAILSMPRYEALREAEEQLQEPRFEPADDDEDEKQATIDALTRRVNELAESNARGLQALNGRGRYIHEQAAEIARLREDAKVRSEAAAPPGPEAPRDDEDPARRIVLGDLVGHLTRRTDHLMQKTDQLSNTDGVFLKHLQDLQSEIEGIKGRLDAQDKAVGEKLGTIFDRLGAFAGRMNQLKAREVAKT